jgi:UDP-N-acetylmuramoyl-L-alanyl-D-glutamate--2,6-diaminopimelate ligase
MNLKKIIGGLEISRMEGSGSDPAIRAIRFDSRAVEKGDMFVAVRGTRTDGHRYIQEALSRGAACVVCELLPEGPDPGIPRVVVPDSRKALALMASAFYGHPSRELQLVGVTGTNGKTTVTTLLHQLHCLLHFRAGLLSTIQVLVDREPFPATHTTPDPVRVNGYLRQMAGEGCEYCFMEVSSHAIDQERIGGLHFTGGIFTNLTHDHLDYHKDFREYLTVKKRFFDGLPAEAFALVNSDDRNAPVMVQNCRARKYTYGMQAVSDFQGRIREMHLEGSSLLVNGREVWVALPGTFNASNLLSVYGASILLGHHPDDVLEALSQLVPVRGRFETYRSPSGATGIVDYAHTPDALKNVLESIRQVIKAGGKIITVVGAGGDRDRQKRPVMARIAAEASYRTILTSDNPRSEDPEQILDEMMEGIPAGLEGSTLRIVSREEAIRTACVIAQRGDIILVAGKGHEAYQETRGEKVKFDDMEILRKNMN